MAAGVAAAASGSLTPALGWDLEVAAVHPLRTERFVVDNLGTAYETAPIAFLTTLSLSIPIL